MITAKLDLPLYETGATYKQKVTWASIIPLVDISYEFPNLKVVTQHPHELLTGSLVSLQEVFPAYFNTINTAITVIDAYSFYIAPSLIFPDRLVEPASFSEYSCRVPINLTGCTALFTIRDGKGNILKTLTDTAGVTLFGASGELEIYISDEDTAALSVPVEDEIFTYILDIGHPNGEVSRLSAGKLQTCGFGKKVNKDLFCVNSYSNFLVITAPQGAPGTPGLSSGSGVLDVIYPITSPGSQSISLPGVITPIWADVYVNGLLQPRTEFTITGSVIDLPPSLELVPDDVVIILYQ